MQGSGCAETAAYLQGNPEASLGHLKRYGFTKLVRHVQRPPLSRVPSALTNLIRAVEAQDMNSSRASFPVRGYGDFKAALPTLGKALLTPGYLTSPI